MRRILLFVAGLVAGMAFVLACETGRGRVTDAGSDIHVAAGRDAHANPNDCTTWQVAYLAGQSVGPAGAPLTLPAGWEPFVAYGMGSPADLFLRRCAP